MSRPIKYEATLARKIAKSVIREDPFRSYVELITNSEDSFNRLTSDIGQHRIVIGLKRGRDQATFFVSDNAEGMTREKMDSAVGGYGFETSGHKEGKQVRGLFGRGLKEAILGLGEGVVESIQDNIYYKCTLTKDGIYDSEDPSMASDEDRRRLMLADKEDGTMVTIVADVKENDIRIPLYDNLKTTLQKHVSLRDIMTNPKMKVLLVDDKGRIEQLSYKYPLGKVVLPKSKFDVPGYLDASIEIEVKRADEELTQTEEDYMRDGGLLVRSGTSIHCATLFKFDFDKHARHLFGDLRCDYLDKLIDAEQAVISDKRDGLELRHPFVKALKQITEGVLEPLVRKERDEEEAQRKELETAKTKARFQEAIAELNRIAKLELKTNEGPVEVEEGKRQSRTAGPLVTFQFSTNYAQVVSGKREVLYLKAGVPSYLPSGTKVHISSNNTEVLIHTPDLVLDEATAVEGVVLSKIDAEGRQVGATATITASAGTASVDMMVKVVSKREPGPIHPPPPPKAGLFKEIRFNDVAKPTQRAFYDNGTGIIDIYTRSESVAIYLGPRGENQEKPECQVLVAELVVDVYCRFLAKLKDEKGLLLIPSEKAKIDAIDREHEMLRSKYALIIHKCIVDKTAHRGLIELTQ